jgi:hypothetical protein
LDHHSCDLWMVLAPCHNMVQVPPQNQHASSMTLAIQLPLVFNPCSIQNMKLLSHGKVVGTWLWQSNHNTPQQLGGTNSKASFIYNFKLIFDGQCDACCNRIVHTVGFCP